MRKNGRDGKKKLRKECQKLSKRREKKFKKCLKNVKRMGIVKKMEALQKEAIK